MPPVRGRSDCMTRGGYGARVYVTRTVCLGKGKGRCADSTSSSGARTSTRWYVLYAAVPYRRTIGAVLDWTRTVRDDAGAVIHHDRVLRTWRWWGQRG